MWICWLFADLPPSELSLPLPRPQELLGRSISVITYSSEEFVSMLAQQHHFISAVLEGPKIYRQRPHPQ
jgi:hypothetical protein